jgi:hypothetical protein
MDMALILRRSDAMVQFHPEGLMTTGSRKARRNVDIIVAEGAVPSQWIDEDCLKRAIARSPLAFFNFNQISKIFSQGGLTIL